MIHRQEEIEAWGEDRGIYAHSSSFAQSVKWWEEYTELRKAILKNDIEGVKDGIGDVGVVLVHMAKFSGEEIFLHGSGLRADTETCIDRIAECIARFCIGKESDIDYGSVIVEYLNCIAENYGMTFGECIDHVIPIINARTGHMNEHGIWVKDK